MVSLRTIPLAYILLRLYVLPPSSQPELVCELLDMSPMTTQAHAYRQKFSRKGLKGSCFHSQNHWCREGLRLTCIRGDDSYEMCIDDCSHFCHQCHQQFMSELWLHKLQAHGVQNATDGPYLLLPYSTKVGSVRWRNKPFKPWSMIYCSNLCWSIPLIVSSNSDFAPTKQVPRSDLRVTGENELVSIDSKISIWIALLLRQVKRSSQRLELMTPTLVFVSQNSSGAKDMKSDYSQCWGSLYFISW